MSLPPSQCGMTVLKHPHNSPMLTVYPLLGTTCYVSFERLSSCNLRVDPGFVCMMQHMHGAMGWGTGYNPKSQFQMVANGEPVSALFQYEPEVKFGGYSFPLATGSLIQLFLLWSYYQTNHIQILIFIALY